jgi:hypothetical protein
MLAHMKNMKQTLKLTVITLLILVSCDQKEISERHKKAKNAADYIINNLDKPEIVHKFPDKHFDKTYIAKNLSYLRENCDWKNRNGKYVDSFSQKKIGGDDRITFFYEFFLKCDSIRIIFDYIVENEEPEFVYFGIEQIEKPNKMIINPSKQLLNNN